MSPRIIHIPLSGGDRKAQANGIRYAHGTHASAYREGMEMPPEIKRGNNGDVGERGHDKHTAAECIGRFPDAFPDVIPKTITHTAILDAGSSPARVPGFRKWQPLAQIRQSLRNGAKIEGDSVNVSPKTALPGHSQIIGQHCC
jgi:hypothetical protein